MRRLSLCTHRARDLFKGQSHRASFDVLVDGLRLDKNALEGAIPSEIGSMSSLGIVLLLALQSCRLLHVHSTDSSHRVLSTIPVQLYLDENTLSGTIPTEIGRLERLGTPSMLLRM